MYAAYGDCDSAQLCYIRQKKYMHYVHTRTHNSHTCKDVSGIRKNQCDGILFQSIIVPAFFCSSHNLPLNGNFRCVKKNIKNAQLLQLNAAASFQLQTDSIGLLKDALEKYVLFSLQMFMHILCQLDGQFVYSHKRLTAVAWHALTPTAD